MLLVLIYAGSWDRINNTDAADPALIAGIQINASKSSIQRFVITEKAPTRAFSWLKAATTAFTFKTLLTIKTLC